MRFASIALFLSATASQLAHAASKGSAYGVNDEMTVFNGKDVPPIVQLTPDNYEEKTAKFKYNVIKWYSPVCPHCQDFAPKFQTLYEFYYTSEVPGSSGTTSKTDSAFQNYYDIQFAMVNCLAYGDLCGKLGYTRYPRTSIFKNGEEVNAVSGNKEMDVVAEAIEEVLDKEKPGSRPKKLLLPDAEASFSPEFSSTTTTNKDSSYLDSTVAELRDKKPAAKPTKPTVTPNPNGDSLPLTAESFQKFVTMTQEPWFVKFYAPWCQHCQAMATNWQQLAKQMKGRLNIGEVNCDVESRLCKDVGLRGYPTMLFFKGGERVEYDGLRGLGDLVQYSEKAIDICSGISDVDLASFEALEEKEEVIFVYFYDHATTSEDFRALERLPLSLIGHAKIVKTNDPKMYERFKITTWPRMLVARQGRPTYYNPLTPRENRDTHLVLNWMKSVWLPIVAELSASNAREIMDGKIVVLGILNREDDEGFLRAKREMTSAANEWMDKQIQLFQMERQDLRDAKQLRIEEAEDRNDERALKAAKQIRIDMDMSDRKEVAFAWVDGVFWQRWIRTTYGIDIKDGERVIINDEDNRQYWDQTITGNSIVPSRTSILETISKVTSPSPPIKPKLTVSSFEKFFLNIRMTFHEHPYLSFGCAAGVALFFWTFFRNRLRRSGFRLEDNLPIKELRDGLLGGTANGKVD